MRGPSRTLRELTAVTPSPGSWVAATQAMLAVVLPAVVFTAAGAASLGLLASFGALVVMYLSGRSRRERAAKLPVIAAGFVLGSLLGILTGDSLTASLLAIGAVAIAFSFLSLAFDVGPPGAIFPVLTTGSMGQLTAPASSGGAAMDPGVVLATIVVGILAGYAAVVAPLLVPAVRRRDALAPADHGWTFTFTPESARILARLTVGILLALLVSAALGLHHAAWVLLAVLGILQKDADVHRGTIRMAQRVLGTALGGALALLFLLWTPERLALLTIVGVLVFGFVALVRRNLLFALMLVTPMALLLVTGGDRDRLLESVLARVGDTAIGAVVAVLVLGAALLSRRAGRRLPASPTHTKGAV